MTALALVGALVLPACTAAHAAGGGGKDYKLTVIFNKTISLYPNSDLRVLGLPAGKVTTVKLDGNNVKVGLKVKKDVNVPADVHATIVPLSLIGERYVQLFPVWTEGQPKAKDGDVIPLERTEVPVEPDEALAALKKFLDALDPNNTGRLVKNLSNDLEGNGQSLNDALNNFSQLVTTLADKDESIGRIIDNFDRFSATLETREVQLGKVMDAFANATSLLAEERRTVESIVHELADFSTNGLDLVSVHRARLGHDIDVLTRVLQSVRANIGSVQELLDSGPLLAKGLNVAYAPDYHRIDLRTELSPTVAQALKALGVPPTNLPCVPVDVKCEPPSQSSSAPPPASGQAAAPAPGSAPGASASANAGSTTTAPSTTTTTANPIDSISRLLGGGGGKSLHVGAIGANPSVAEQVASATGGFFGLFRRAAQALLGVLR